MNLYWAYHGVEFKPIGRHANWDDAAHYADGRLPGWHTVVDADQLLALHTLIGTQLGLRLPFDELYARAVGYLEAVEQLDPADPEYWVVRRRVTSAKAQLEAFIRQHAKEK